MILLVGVGGMLFLCKNIGKNEEYTKNADLYRSVVTLNTQGPKPLKCKHL